MRFGSWYPLAAAGAEAPPVAGVFQVRLASGLLAYPRGRSAMLHYAAAGDLRAAAAAFAAAHRQCPWLCRHAEADDAAAAQVDADRLRERFRRQFGSPPRLPGALVRSFKLRLAERHARLVWADGATRDLEGPAFAALAQAAGPLIEQLAGGRGAVRALSVALDARVARATLAMGQAIEPVRVDGGAFERELAPLCATVLAAIDALSPGNRSAVPGPESA